MGAADGALLKKDHIDRVVVARLIESPPASYPLSPLNYLMSCYARCLDEQRSKAIADNQSLLAVVQDARSIIISYSGLTLAGGGIIPQVRNFPPNLLDGLVLNKSVLSSI